VITCGGADPQNITGLVVGAIQASNLSVRWTVIVGAANVHGDSIKAACAGDPRFSVIHHAPDLRTTLLSADLAVLAVGGTMWEAAATGLPAVVIGGTPIQDAVGAMAGSYGAHHYAGKVSALSRVALTEAVTALASDADCRRKMSSLGQTLIDGRGAERAAEALLSSAHDWTVREARAGDSEPVWEIAAAPDVRQRSFDARPFPFTEHRPWFEARLARADAATWVIVRDDVVGGFVRFDLEDRRAMVSIAVAAPFRGRGLATRLLRETSERARVKLSADHVCGLVFEDNPASQAAFERAGFRAGAASIVKGKRCAVFEWDGAVARRAH
jgi:RimJ/RimL family protein N-acetyltransferase